MMCDREKLIDKDKLFDKDKLGEIDSPDSPNLWLRASFWLLLLGPLFFASYGAVNAYTAGRSDVGVLVYSWEQYIPFWDWTIVPYMSIDLLYAVSLFLCSSKMELDQHGKRLLLATLISVVCFLLFPLQFSFVRPDASGVYGWLFDILTAFDQPYNQAPSLHISLLVLIWRVFNHHISNSVMRFLMHGWMFLIGISVLTTWQHHFVDVIGGLAVALVLIYALPDTPLVWQWQRSKDPAAIKLAFIYILGSGLLLSFVMFLGGWFWMLLWPATATFLVGIAYGGAGVSVFQYQIISRESVSNNIAYRTKQMFRAETASKKGFSDRATGEIWVSNTDKGQNLYTKNDYGCIVHLGTLSACCKDERLDLRKRMAEERAIQKWKAWKRLFWDNMVWKQSSRLC